MWLMYLCHRGKKIRNGPCASDQGSAVAVGDPEAAGRNGGAAGAGAGRFGGRDGAVGQSFRTGTGQPDARPRPVRQRQRGRRSDGPAAPPQHRLALHRRSQRIGRLRALPRGLDTLRRPLLGCQFHYSIFSWPSYTFLETSCWRFYYTLIGFSLYLPSLNGFNNLSWITYLVRHLKKSSSFLKTLVR